MLHMTLIQDSLIDVHIYKGGWGFDLLILPDYLLTFPDYLKTLSEMNILSRRGFERTRKPLLQSRSAL